MFRHTEKTCEGQARRSLQFVWIGLVIFWIFCVMALQVSIPSDPGAEQTRGADGTQRCFFLFLFCSMEHVAADGIEDRFSDNS